MELNKLINDDCMNVLKDIPDNYFELAIVDPPYGGGVKQTAQACVSTEETDGISTNNLAGGYFKGSDGRFGGWWNKYRQEYGGFP